MFNFCAGTSTTTNYGLTVGATSNAIAYWSTDQSAYKEVLRTKILKVSGINTLTWYALIANSGSETTAIQVSTGVYSSSASNHSGNQVWVNNTLDISALTASNFYDIVIEMKYVTSATAQLYYIIGFGS
jgi:hypothetical protein